jgi:lysophospholipase L1-like esterase
MKKNALKSLLFISALINISLTTYIGIKKYKEHNIKHLAYFMNRQNVYSVLPVESKDVVFLGDSHTQYFDVAEFFNTTLIKNRGISGDLTSGVLNRLRPIINGHPAKIFLQIGINDLHRGISIDSAVKNVARIIRSIQQDSPGTEIFVESLFPTVTVNQADVLKYNDSIKVLSFRNNIMFIDLYNTFSEKGKLNSKYDCGDGLHLNGKGYMEWRNILNKYLNKS